MGRGRARNMPRFAGKSTTAGCFAATSASQASQSARPITRTVYLCESLLSCDSADLLSFVLGAEPASFCALTAEMSLTLSSRPGANVLSRDSVFADLSVSTALSPVSITFSRAIAVARSFASLVPRCVVPKTEDAPPFDDAAPLDEEASVDEAPAEEALELEEPLDDKPEAPAESRALAPTLVSLTL